MTEQRVLPADVYDALELSALAFGGIGAGWFTENYYDWMRPATDGIPLCAFGYAGFLDGHRVEGVVHDALYIADITSQDNDSAVHRVNAERGSDKEARIFFKRWCKELHVVRGR